MGFRPLDGKDIGKNTAKDAGEVTSQVTNTLQNLARIGIGIMYNRVPPPTNLKYCGKCFSPFSYTDDKIPKRCGVCSEPIDWSQQPIVKQKECPKCGYVPEYDAVKVCPYEDDVVYLQ